MLFVATYCELSYRIVIRASSYDNAYEKAIFYIAKKQPWFTDYKNIKIELCDDEEVIT